MRNVQSSIDYEMKGLYKYNTRRLFITYSDVSKTVQQCEYMSYISTMSPIVWGNEGFACTGQWTSLHALLVARWFNKRLMYCYPAISHISPQLLFLW